jgi:OOP family OmpA-OmpF porin
MTKQLFLLFLIFHLYYTNFTNGQTNMVLNGSFEESSTCPEDQFAIKDVLYWGQLSSTFSSQYYSSCSKSNLFKVPTNKFGSQNARTGGAYIGMNSPEGAIETKLISPLSKDSLYYVEFYLSLADTSGYAINDFGAMFSDTAIHGKSFQNVFLDDTRKPQVKNLGGRYITDKKGWTKVSGYYKAKGNESYVIISFTFTILNFSKIKWVDNKGLSQSYYYLDDVLVIPASQKDNLENYVIQPNSTIVLKNVQFEYGKSNLIANSYSDLNKVLAIMNKNPKMSIEISGHTDNKGNEKSNLALSNERAKTVYTYLISQGIEKQRIEFKGYGSSQPIADNETEFGQQLNRRVEIKILKVK